MRQALRFRDGLRHKFPRPLRERVRVRGQKKPLKTHMTLSVIPQQFECITPELTPCGISKVGRIYKSDGKSGGHASALPTYET